MVMNRMNIKLTLFNDRKMDRRGNGISLVDGITYPYCKIVSSLVVNCVSICDVFIVFQLSARLIHEKRFAEPTTLSGGTPPLVVRTSSHCIHIAL